MFVTRNVFMKYRNPTDGDGNDLGGGGDDGKGEGGEGEGDPAEGEGEGKGEGAGKKGPTDQEAKLIKENMRKKAQIDALTKQLSSAQELARQLEELGGLETIKSLVGERKDAETKALEAKGDYDRLRQRMAEEHAKEVKAKEARIAELESVVAKSNGMIADLTVGTQFSQSKFISDELTLTPSKARTIYGDYFDIQDGSVVGFDKPRGSASRTALVDQYGAPVGFDEAMRKIVEADPERDHLLKSKIKPGAGSNTSKRVKEGDKEVPTDSVNKIAAGLKGLKLA